MRISDWSSDVCSSDLLELTPGFIERNPYDNGWEIIIGIHNGFPFGPENRFRFGRTITFRAHAGNTGTGVPLVAQITAWHILPYKHPQFVAMVKIGRAHV